jgi:hypothetical protein
MPSPLVELRNILNKKTIQRGVVIEINAQIASIATTNGKQFAQAGTSKINDTVLIKNGIAYPIKTPTSTYNV